MDNPGLKSLELTPELYNHCLEFLRERKVLDKTRILYTKELDNIFKQKQLTQMLYNKIYSKGNYYKAVLKLIIDVCYHFDIPVPKYKSIRAINRSKPTPQVWREEQILKMAEDIEDYGLLILCAYYIGAGLRFSSAIMLSWEDFEWEDWIKDKSKHGKVRIFAKGSKESFLIVDRILMQKLHDIATINNKCFLGIPYKNRVEDKYLFLKKIDLEAYEGLIKKQNFDKMLENDPNTINERDRARNIMIKLLHGKVDYKLKKLSESYGKKIKFHSIRHSRATNLLKKNIKLETIKEQLMHKSIRTTEVYIHLVDKDMEKEFEEKL